MVRKQREKEAKKTKKELLVIRKTLLSATVEPGRAAGWAGTGSSQLEPRQQGCSSTDRNGDAGSGRAERSQPPRLTHISRVSAS